MAESNIHHIPDYVDRIYVLGAGRNHLLRDNGGRAMGTGHHEGDRRYGVRALLADDSFRRSSVEGPSSVGALTGPPAFHPPLTRGGSDHGSAARCRQVLQKCQTVRNIAPQPVTSL